MAQFRIAVERASSRWGGIGEPIIPVSSGGRIGAAWKQIVEALAPDIAFDCSGLSAEGQARAGQQLSIEVRPVANENSPFSGAHPLIVEHSEGPTFASSSTKLPVLFAGPGLVPAWDSGADWAPAGLIVTESDDELASAVNQLRGTTLIEATGSQCGEVSMAGMFAGFGLLWVADASSLKDALWFWNMRALMPRSFGPRVAALVTPRAAADPQFIDQLGRIKTNQKWTSPDLILLSLSIENAQLTAIAKVAGIEVSEKRTISFHFGVERDHTEPLTALLQGDPRAYLLGDRVTGARTTDVVTIESPVTVIRVTSPVRFSRFGIGGHIKVRLSAPFLQVPHRDSVARLFLGNGVWRQGGLEIETDALPIYHFDLNVPRHDEVLREAVGAAGIRFEASQPGRLAGALGGMIPPSERIFVDENVRAVVRALTTPRSRTLVDLITEHVATEGASITIETAAVLADRIGPQLTQVAKPLADLAGRANVPQVEAGRVVERLVRLGLAERGLLVLCDKCKLRPFVPLRSVSDAGTCPACNSDASFSANSDAELQIHYRLNALLDRASDQGVVPHLAILDQLGVDPETSHFVLGAQLFDGSGPFGEVDLLGYRGASLICGEVKTSAAGFSREEIEKAVRLAARVQADLVVFGCTAELPQDLVDTMFATAKPQVSSAQVIDPSGVRAPVPVAPLLLPMT